MGTLEEVGGNWVLMGSGGRRLVAVLCLGLLHRCFGSYRGLVGSGVDSVGMQ